MQLESGRLESLLDYYHAEKEKIGQWNRERDLFPIPDGQDMVGQVETHLFVRPVVECFGEMLLESHLSYSKKHFRL